MLLIAGCEEVNVPTRITDLPEGKSQPTVLPSVTQSTTAAPTSTFSIPTATETRISSVPTFSATESMSILFELMKTNGGCNLPCFMGIVPGETTFDEAKEVFTRVGWSIYILPQSSGDTMESRYAYNESSLTAYAWLRNVDNRIPYMYISISGHSYLDYVDYYALVNIMRRFGKPDGIWISLSPDLKEMRFKETSFDMFLYYKGNNMIFHYSGVAKLERDTYKICPPEPWELSDDISPEEGTMSVYMADKAVELSPKELLAIYLKSADYFLNNKFQVETMLNMDIDKFYKDIMEKENTACYKIPENVWP